MVGFDYQIKDGGYKSSSFLLGLSAITICFNFTIFVIPSFGHLTHEHVLFSPKRKLTRTLHTYARPSAQTHTHIGHRPLPQGHRPSRFTGHRPCYSTRPSASQVQGHRPLNSPRPSATQVQGHRPNYSQGHRPLTFEAIGQSHEILQAIGLTHEGHRPSEYQAIGLQTFLRPLASYISPQFTYCRCNST